jgi:hypothetical protein
MTLTSVEHHAHIAAIAGTRKIKLQVEGRLEMESIHIKMYNLDMFQHGTVTK